MIDTIRFAIHLSQDQLDYVKSKCREITDTDKSSGEIKMKIYKKEINLPSYDYNLNLFIYQDDCIYLEFSAPKIFYGHNIYLLYPKDFPKVFEEVQFRLEKAFDMSFGYYDTWTIQRLDISYAWKFLTQEQAEFALLLLNVYSYARKDKEFRGNSLKFKGSAYDVKFYLKFDEYLKHDQKRFLKIENYDMAYNLADLAEGVLRYEVLFRKEQLQYIFEKKVIHLSDISDLSLLENLLTQYFKRMISQADTKVMDYKEIADKIFETYKPKQAWNLLEFYNLFFNSDKNIMEVNRHLLKHKRHRSTISRKLHLLAKAGIGINNQNHDIIFDFKIPSEYAVNKPDDWVASAPDHLTCASMGGNAAGTVVKGLSEASLDEIYPKD